MHLGLKGVALCWRLQRFPLKNKDYNIEDDEARRDRRPTLKAAPACCFFVVCLRI